MSGNLRDKKISMVSLGCPKNQVDAEQMLFKLKEAGYQIVVEPGESDIVIVNTCGFIQSAKEEAIENIVELVPLKEERTIKKIVVTGCLAERYRDELVAEFPEVDGVIPLGCNGDIVKLIDKVASDKKVHPIGEKCDLPLEGDRLIMNLPFFAYLKIAEGCDNCCSYCAIPQIRGGYRSRPMENIIAEAKKLAEGGVTELIVVAQDTTKYGEDLYGESKLPELLSELCKIEGLHWIRTLYAYPERISDKLLKVLSEEEKLVKYLDIPIQHCDGDILSAMNRPGNEKMLRDLVSHIRETVPGITLRTTLIAGFPGETKEQFSTLCQFVKDVRFDRLGCFAYSEEEGTVAGMMENQVDEQERIDRSELVMAEQMNIMDQENQKKVGSTLEVVVEGFDRWGECYFGRSKADAPDIDGKVFFTSEKKLAIGQYCNVRVTDVVDLDLMGEIVL